MSVVVLLYLQYCGFLSVVCLFLPLLVCGLSVMYLPVVFFVSTTCKVSALSSVPVCSVSVCGVWVCSTVGFTTEP